jgi:hypothetical protein
VKRRRPELRIELGRLGTVDPFGLRLVRHPPGSSEHFLEDPRAAGRLSPVEPAALHLVGASQALLGLSMRWMAAAGRDAGAGDPPTAEIRLAVRRREARLLSALLKRHLARLPEPPAWMPELLVSLEQIDEFLRWDDVPPLPEDEGP